MEIFLSQKSYRLELLAYFGKSGRNSCDLPMIANTHIDKSSGLGIVFPSYKELSNVRSLYMSLVGKLCYLSVAPRPDLRFIVSSLSHVLKNLSQEY